MFQTTVASEEQSAQAVAERKESIKTENTPGRARARPRIHVGLRTRRTAHRTKKAKPVRKSGGAGEQRKKLAG